MGEIAAAGSSYLGEGAALLAAFLWAAATLMFGRLGRQLSPLALNIVKGLWAIAMMALTLGIQFGAGGVPALPGRAVLILVLSGALGIGVGDTAYFAAINTLGARRALLLETLAPPIAAVLAWLFLDEQLPLVAICGIAITLAGVAWVISERTPGTTAQNTKTGVQIALLATFCQATGAVLSRAALAGTEVSPLWSSFIRLSAGLFFMCGLALLKSEQLETPEPRRDATVSETTLKASTQARGHRMKRQRFMKTLRSPKLIIAVAAASFFGTYLGIWLQQVSLKNTETGIAQALLATSPLFIIPMSAVLGEKLSWRAVLGVGVALGGVWLLLFAS